MTLEPRPPIDNRESAVFKLRRRKLQELIASYEKEKGTITASELAAVQAEWLE